MDIDKELRDILSHLGTLLRTYEEIGLDPPPVSMKAVGLLKAAEPTLGAPPPRAQQGGAKAHDPDPGASLLGLREHIGDCRRCKLFRGRTHLVFGEGSPHARLVFVGEGPGMDEDRIGRPFVGKSGNLLTRIIENGMGLTRDEVYICNVVKCRPPENRDPEPDEIEACAPFLKEQLRIIGPEVICTLGRVAGQSLLGRRFKITEERGRWTSYQGIPLMPTFHPAYLLHNESAKREVWEDIKQIMKRIGLEVKTRG